MIHSIWIKLDPRARRFAEPLTQLPPDLSAASPSLTPSILRILPIGTDHPQLEITVSSELIYPAHRLSLRALAHGIHRRVLLPPSQSHLLIPETPKSQNNHTMASTGVDYGDQKILGEKPTYDQDVEGDRRASIGSVKNVQDSTHRKLKPRHIQLIGIGGTIGTALYVQIGRGLMNGGPASLFMAFTIWYVENYSSWSWSNVPRELCLTIAF